MPATINVNNRTVVHATSGGICTGFPDVCKTPTPGGPVPIPYPNIAKSQDTAMGSATVTLDGNPIMLKGSCFALSTGDEAGSAGGMVSSVIKGKAEFINYSFDVMVEGKNVCRLGDMMLLNNKNTPPAPLVQPPIVFLPGIALQPTESEANTKDWNVTALEFDDEPSDSEDASGAGDEQGGDLDAAEPAGSDQNASEAAKQEDKDKQAWVELEVVDDLGEPWHGRLQIVTADGCAHEVATNEKGFIRLDGIQPGSVKVSPPVPPGMVHVVKQGECLSSIAYAYGFASYKTLYEHPDNAAFRKARPDPAHIFPGDKIRIPVTKATEQTLSTEKRHKLTIKVPRAHIRLHLRDRDGSPLASQDYVLRFAGQAIKGRTTDRGLVDELVPAAIQEAILELPKLGLNLQVRCGTVDPVETTTGLQHRLNALGFSAGAVDGIFGPRTEDAVRRFQEANRLTVSGTADSSTCNKLVQAYGS